MDDFAGWIFVAMGVGLGVLIGLHTCNPEELSNRGGAGQACYPNGTCDKPNTCFRIRDAQQCEREIKIVFNDSMPACYSVLEAGQEKQHCFKTQSECLVNFSRGVATFEKVLVGCGP